MLAYLVLLLAVLSRILPHAFHAVSWNFTAVGAGLLFFGSRMDREGRPSWRTWAKLASAVAVLIATDYYLTVFVFAYPFRASHYLFTWLWYGAVCVVGMELLRETTVLRVAAGILASATSFFLLSNFAVWAGGGMYPRTGAGLGACYIAGLPFYRNDLVSTALTAGVLFGLPVLAAKIADSMHAAQDTNFPTA